MEQNFSAVLANSRFHVLSALSSKPSTNAVVPSAHRGRPLQLQIVSRALAPNIAPRCAGFVAELHNSALFVPWHWVSEHNISVSGNPSQKVISSRQPVIYSKCLNELKRVSPGLKLLVLAHRCLRCFLLLNKICPCLTGWMLSLTFMLYIYLEVAK